MEPTLMARPANVGKAWKVEDDQSLVNALATSKTISQIADEFGRTNGSIVARQNHLARMFVREEGKTLEEAALITRRTVVEVEQALSASPSSSRGPPKPKMSVSNSAEETLLSVAIEIRELLRELVRTKRTFGTR